MTRLLVLGIAVLFVAGFAFLTVREIVRAGPTPLVILSLVLVIVLGAGVIGALATPPDD